jgi:hypothetical protein
MNTHTNIYKQLQTCLYALINNVTIMGPIGLVGFAKVLIYVYICMNIYVYKCIYTYMYI